MRIEAPSQERLAGFNPGDRVNVQYDTRRGSLSITVGTITAIDRRGVTVDTGGRFPVTFEWPAIRTIGRA